MDGAFPPTEIDKVGPDTEAYLEALKKAGFSGDIETSLSSRLVSATDNSIYQVMPQAVVYPQAGDDINLVMAVANQEAFRHLKFYARGGGTSTNGQSLGSGIVVDISRHMRGILDFDPETGLVRVEPGLVRDSLNEFLAAHGRFFAPHVSTTNRATIGGMVSNDSSGKGSVVYGKTSDHVASIECVLANGEIVELDTSTPVEECSTKAGLTLAQDIHALIAPNAAEIADRFPNMKRGFTGYNLKEALNPDGSLNLVKLVCGSEGTLSLMKSVTLKTEKIPHHTVLAILTFESHDAGLRAIPDLLSAKPHAIEFIDDKILGAALRSPFAEDARNVLGIDETASAMAAHFFEMSDDDPRNLEKRLEEFLAHIETTDASIRPTAVRVVRDAQEIGRVWEIRRACQGLLAGFDKNKRAVAFIEDCAVPPENLADFVAELEATLSARNIPLGMYGHADVGCVHIRPLMNLTAEDERRQIREISDAVFDLTLKYGGLIWGEHGKGLRGEYSERVIGENLYGVMRRVKGVFDPENRLNPGKIARPIEDPAPVFALDGVTMRGAFDEEVTKKFEQSVAHALRCDGNGACFNLDDAQPLCPSYKATGDRRQSPKGRASLLRAWARERSLGHEETAQDIAAELTEVLDTCLACKACAGGGCPARVDIPEMKSQFLDWYHRQNRRPLSDMLVSRLEELAPVLDRVGGSLLNRIQALGPVRAMMSRIFGLVDLPELRDRRSVLKHLQKMDVLTQSASELLNNGLFDRSRTVVIVQDCFTTFYDPDALVAQIGLVQELGYEAVLLKYRAGGKPLHVRGFLDRFEKLARRNAQELSALSADGYTLLGVDGATTLMYRHEYLDALDDCPPFDVLMLGEWLGKIDLPMIGEGQKAVLVQHCTERSLAAESTTQWADAFVRLGIAVEIRKTGCCGMSGLFGHEAHHTDISSTLYDQNWRDIVSESAPGTLVATGYSCRSQVKRKSQVTALHPAEYLLRVVSSGGPTATADT